MNKNKWDNFLNVLAMSIVGIFMSALFILLGVGVVYSEMLRAYFLMIIGVYVLFWAFIRIKF